MINTKTKAAGKALAVLLVLTLLFAANCAVLSASADTLGTTIYLKTNATTTPYLHYWNSAKTGSSWPGVAMVSEGNDLYSYELPCDIGDLEGVIFKKDGGSGDDSKLTQDVTNITGNLYDLTSSIKIKSVSADVESPYVGSKVTLAMAAEGGDGKLSYKISVDGTVLSDYSSKTSVLWTPDKAGSAVVLFEVKDGSGETNSRQMSFDVKSVDNAEEPIFLSASPANGSKVKKDSAVTVDVNGAGGHVNNDILFYKTEVLDPNGNAVNTAYYKTGKKITFTPSLVGEYTIVMYIQNNTTKNTTTTATYTYVSTTEEIITDTDSEEPIIVSDTDSATDSEIIVSDTDSTTDSEIVVSDTDTVTDTDSAVDSDTDSATDSDVEPDVGDIDDNGKVELKDAYTIQASVIVKRSFSADEVTRGDVNKDGKISLKDASLIQQYKVGLAYVADDGRLVSK